MAMLKIKENKNSPAVLFDPDSGNFKISGRSFPENARKFYQPVLDWLDEFSPNGTSNITFDFELYYISSSSIIAILEVIRRISLLKREDSSITINWYYDDDDEDMRKIGEDYTNVIDLPFNLIIN